MATKINIHIYKTLILLLLLVSNSFCIYAQTTFKQRSESNIIAAPGEPKRIKYGDGSETLQATHEQRQIIYVRNGENKKLHIPTDHIRAYQRWYRYDEISNLPTGFTPNGSYTTLAPTKHGVVKTDAIANRPTVNYSTRNTTIACDLSKNGMSSGNEPLLAYRMIYDIRDASEMANRLDNAYKNNPLEYYEMTAPLGKQLLIGPKYTYINGISKQGSNEIHYESNYYITNNGTLSTVSYSETSSGVSQFQWYCEEEPSKTINSSTTYCQNNSQISNGYVYNGRILALAPVTTVGTVRNWYLINNNKQCIAHFKITYESVDDIGPKVGGIDKKDKKTLDESYKHLLERNFDYLDADKDNVYFKGYPLPWSEGSYGFFSSSSGTPDWSQYAFVKNFNTMNWCHQNVTDHTGGGRMYYIDASETPGIISNLDISQACCPGTQLYISTWIHNANRQGNLGPNMNFEIVGIQSDGSEDVFKSYTTGTIACRNQTSLTNSENDSWLQVYFSATVPRSSYSKMYFRIINNQLSSSGNDFAIDDINIYMMKPAVSAEVRAPMCGENAVAHINIEYNKLLDIVAMISETQNETLPIGYCFVDKIIYDNYLDNGMDKHGNIIPEEQRTEENALKEARIECVNTASVNGSDYFNYFLLKRGFSSNGATTEDKLLNFYLDTYEEEPDIKDSKYSNINDYNTAYANALANSPNRVLRSMVKDEDNKDVPGLSFQTTLKSTDDMPIAAGRDYYIIFNIQNDLIVGDVLTPSHINNLVDPNLYTKGKLCDVYSEFELIGTAVIEVNGSSSLYYGGTDMCANTRPTFTVKQLSYIIDGELKNVDSQQINIYFDWFHGDFAEFKSMKYYPIIDSSSAEIIGYTETDNGKEPFSISQAVDYFRSYYPSARTVEGHLEVGNYTKAMKFLLIDLTQEAASGFESDRKLLLYRRSFSPLISEPLGAVHSYLAIPISGSVINDGSVEGANLICLDPQLIVVTASAKAPSIGIGLDEINYGDITSVPIRIGLSQIKEVTSEIIDPSTTKSKYYLKIPIQRRSISFSTDDYTNILNVDDKSARYQSVYLADSDDPSDAIQTAIDNSELMGYINWLNITKDVDGTNYVGIYFKVDKDGKMPINMREGYSYYLKFFFSEYYINETTMETSNTCEGSVIIPLKIVPEYQVWIGGEDMRNWNNDANWRRANQEDFHASSDYLSNDNYYYPHETPGSSFVPLEFTKVIIDKKENDVPKLIALEPKSKEDLSLDMSTKEDGIGASTSNIEYDLVINYKIKEGEEEFYPCTSFYANTCEEIYFKPGAALMNPHYLKYDTARVEFTIDTRRWYLLGAPLQGVVAGDMYTLKSGIQSTDAFESVFYSPTNNNRYNPHVYQRGWDKVKAIVYDFNGGSSDPNAQTEREAAVKATWSSVYNDVAVQYVPGVGYSIKSVPDANNDRATTTIRLPKNDLTYRYYTADNQTDTADDKDVTSLKAHGGRLASDNLTTDSPAIEVDLSESKDGENNLGINDEANKLYLLANPFMTHLDMRKFFEVNRMFKPAYWLMKVDGEGKQIGVIMDGEEVIGASSSDATSTIAPMQGFFVELDSEKVNPIVKYSIDMMSDPVGPNALTRSTENISQLFITSTRDGISGTATLRIANENADETDMQNLPTLLDSNWDPYPLIYTIGNNQAMQIQTVKNVSTIPLGIYSNSEDEVMVTFENVNAFEGLALYDSYLDETIDLNHDMSIMLPGNTNGRYLLTFNSAMEDDLLESITISSVDRGSIWITSDFNDPIQEIVVYDVNGRLYKQLTSIGNNSYSVNIEGGLYIVQVRTLQATKTAKVMVKN